MLQGYGFGQQSYSMHHGSWQNGYQHGSHLSGSGMPIMPNCYMESPPELSTHHMMMYHGNHAVHQAATWHAQSMHQNAWQAENMRQQQHCMLSQDKYGRFNRRYAMNVGLGAMASTGGKYSNMIGSSEYESFSRMQQAPATVRFEAMRYEHSDCGGNGHDSRRIGY